MKDHIIQFLLGIILTFCGIVIGIFFSIETPLYWGESFALMSILILNAFWFIPYSVHFIKRNETLSHWITIGIYLLFFIPFGIYVWYERPFDSEKWKSELNHNVIYDKYPAHKNGDMIENIINSQILIGLKMPDIEKTLGTNYYITEYENDTTLWFFYTNKNVFDGCDKLYVEVRNNLCVKSGFGGCD